MKFGSRAPADARGAINVHTLRAGGHVIKKGCVLGDRELDAMVSAGIAQVVCAELEPGELGEDEAAATLARALAGPNLSVDPAHTGRANIRASSAGVFLVDGDAIARINAVDEAITVATIARDAPVRPGTIVATIKVIPFAVPVEALAKAVAAAVALAVAPFAARRAGLVLTRFADTHARVLDRAAKTQRQRLEALGGSLARELRVGHDVEEVAAALTEMAAEKLDPILILGASAIVDRRDVIPAAVVRAGGAIVRYGMPVDPGNLVLLGTLGDATVIGLPGCARSPDRSGFDWVLERACAGVPISAGAITSLGVGGLIVDGPRLVPLAATAPSTSGVAAVVLAAGHSSRMGTNKLLAELDGVPIVRHAALAALGSHARPVVVVTGNDRERVHAALAGLDVRFAHNAEFATGMASSLRTGIAAVGEARAAIVCLGDMPRITSAHLDTLVDAFSSADDDRTIVVPTYARKRGNPVVLGRDHFAAISALAGDVGAKSVIERNANHVVAVALDDDAVLVDVDTPEALAALRDVTRSG